MNKKFLFEKTLFFHRLVAEKFGYYLQLSLTPKNIVTPPPVLRVNAAENIMDRIKAYFAEDSQPVEVILKDKSDFDSFYSRNVHIFQRDAAIERLAGIRKKNGDTAFDRYHGFCDVCDEETAFIIDNVWTTHTEGLACEKCNTVSRCRNLYRVIKNAYKTGMKVYISEQVTDFYRYTRRLIPDIIGSEFMPAAQNGMEHVRHEDATHLTFPDKSLDMYVSNDVFEHVFDYQKAFTEAARVLTDEGILIFHIPFYYREKTTVRAQLMEDGTVKYLADPIYHGNPLSADGALWVNDFGWDIFEILEASGFAKAYAVLRNDLYRGLLNESALMFMAHKHPDSQSAL